MIESLWLLVIAFVFLCVTQAIMLNIIMDVQHELDRVSLRIDALIKHAQDHADAA